MRTATVVNMKTIILLLAIAATAYGSITWSDFTVKWAWYGSVTRSGAYYSIPWTATDAVAESWVEVTDVNKLGQSLNCFPDDARFCIIVDSYGNICGVQAGVPVADLASMQSTYNLSRLDWYSVKNMFDDDVWTSTVYFIDPDTIASGGRSDMEGVLGTEGVWIEKTSGYEIVARTTDELDSAWTEEACIPMMGTHYYYNMSTSTDCQDFAPWFLLFQDGELSAVGYQGFGSASVVDRTWWESVPAAAIKPTIPTAPDCLTDWASDYGVISYHIFFTPKSWTISC